MKNKTNRIHRRVDGGLTRPRSARYARARKKRFLTSGSRFTTTKAVKEPASRAASPGDVTLEFFESIVGPHPEVPNAISGSLRFELEDGNRGEHWRVTFVKGVVSSARSSGPSDCIVHTDKATLETIIQGRANAMAALLRGALRAEGKTLFLAYFRRLLTEPAAVHEARRLAKNMGRRS
jgi:putative sterol carrier protein